MTTLQGKAAVLFAPNTPLRVVDVNFEAPKAGEVRVKMRASGLCHSDLYSLKGIECGGNCVDSIDGPAIPGHEGAGVVESVGPGVSKVKPGDHVIILWMTQCGDCVVCTEKPMSNACQKNDFIAALRRKDGTSRIKLVSDGTPILTFLGTATFADYVIAEESNVCKIPEAIPLEVAALVGCCVGTGYGSATNLAKVVKNSVCAVWGLGAVGLSAIIGCKAAGASKIYAIDRLAEKEGLALEVGATAFFNTTGKTEDELIASLRGELGVDYAFECAGAAVCLAQAQKSLAQWGTLVVVGITPNGTTLTIPADNILFGQTFTGAYYGRYKPLDGIGLICKELEEGRLDSVSKLVTHRFPLEKINEGFDLLEKGQTIRSVIQM